jgi:hypothetical protein
MLLQIVSYTQGQYFNLHHDAGTLHDDGSVELVPPRRLATFFLVRISLILPLELTLLVSEFSSRGPGPHRIPRARALCSTKAEFCGCVSEYPFQRFCHLLFSPLSTPLLIAPFSGQPDPRTVHVAKVITRSGLRKFGVNIWLTDLDMQCLAASPPISPLVKKYEKDSLELILQRTSDAPHPTTSTSSSGGESQGQTKRKKKTAAVVQSNELVDESEGKKKRRRSSQ